MLSRQVLFGMIIARLNIGVSCLIQSMTGYGKGECTLYSRKFSVEIKSVNHRYNDITIKLPRVMNPFEEKMRGILTSSISRGKTDVYVNYETFSHDDIKVTLNEALADAYMERLTALDERYALNDMPTLQLIAKFPDVLSVERNADTDETAVQMWETLEEALHIAVERFVDMRTREGLALKADILKKHEQLSSLITSIAERAPLVAKEYRERLQTRVQEALGDTNIDEARLILEVTMFADRSCIDEEITRLSSHLSQLAIFLEEREPVGRKLDFLVQEMNREINTIGSKSNDLDITKLVVEAKSELEKIREQVQNIE